LLGAAHQLNQILNEEELESNDVIVTNEEEEEKMETN